MRQHSACGVLIEHPVPVALEARRQRVQNDPWAHMRRDSLNGCNARAVIEVPRQPQHGRVEAPQHLLSVQLRNNGAVIESAIASSHERA